MNRFLSIFLCIIFAATVAHTEIAGEFKGLDGRAITQIISKDYRPQKYPQNETEIRAAVARYSHTDDGTFMDYFSNSYPLSLDRLEMLPLAAKEWWSASQQTLVTYDLNNIVPANFSVPANRQDYIPGEVANAIYDNGHWLSGIGYIDGFDTNVYEPHDNLKGDFARVYMLMPLLYPRDLWLGRSTMLYLSTHPYLTKYGRDLLLKWHRDDPVDEWELRRNEVIREIQGAGNPFVEYPDLAEYIWGKHVGEIYGLTESDNDSSPSDGPAETPREKQMLKASYSRKDDKWIDLKSPYIDADVTWYFDGVAVSDEIDLEKVSDGQHQISYSGRRSHGKLLITVAQ